MRWAGCSPGRVVCEAYPPDRSSRMATKAGSNVPALAAIGKHVFHLVGLSADSTLAFRRKIKRLALADTFKALPPCLVGMEACLSAHFVSRTLRALGHEPRIIP